MKTVLALVFLFACVDEPPQVVTSPTATISKPPEPAPQNVDVRVELEEGHDEDFGAQGYSVRAFVVAPAIGLRKKLFAVPFPYRCGRGAADAGDELVVQCTGDDGTAYASVHAETGRIVVVARDYGRTELNKTHDAFALPAGATATVFAPAKFPGD